MDNKLLRLLNLPDETTTKNAFVLKLGSGEYELVIDYLNVAKRVTLRKNIQSMPAIFFCYTKGNISNETIVKIIELIVREVT